MIEYSIVMPGEILGRDDYAIRVTHLDTRHFEIVGSYDTLIEAIEGRTALVAERRRQRRAL